MAGVELILGALCLNITCDNLLLEKSPTNADWLKQNCLANVDCKGYIPPDPTTTDNLTSLQRKGFLYFS